MYSWGVRLTWFDCKPSTHQNNTKAITEHAVVNSSFVVLRTVLRKARHKTHLHFGDARWRIKPRLNAAETLVSQANSKATAYISREVIFFQKDPRFGEVR